MSKINKVNSILSSSPYTLSSRERDNIIFLTGEVNTYEEKLAIGERIAKLKAYEHVVNDITVKGLVIPETRYSKEVDSNELNGLHCDVLVIGGGVIGCAILRELSRYNFHSILVEKENDVALHASSRNDGNIHPGIDLHSNTLKLKYLNMARDMWPSLAKELGFRYVKTGQVLTFEDHKLLFNLFVRYKARSNNIKNVTYHNNQEKLKQVEPNIDNPKIKGAIVFNDAAQVSPYEVTIAFAENAITNGAKIYLDTFVKAMKVENSEIKEVVTSKGVIYPKIVINAAGTFSEDIAKLADDHFFSIHPRKGTDLILDKKVFTKYAKHTLGLKHLSDASSKSKTKGGGFVVTVDGNFLIGPDAYETPFKEDFSTEKQSIIEILNKQKGLFKNVTTKDIITYFSGTRACTYEEDFIIQKGKWTKNIIHVAGIQSPGLSCSPAIGKEIAKLAATLLNNPKLNPNFNPIREAPLDFASLPLERKDEYIRRNPNYGEIVCRCEKVSKQEILNAIRRPLPVYTIDGIKRRTRAGMGRCQGGFCEPMVLKILAEEKGLKYTDIKKKGNARVLDRKSK